MAERSSTSVTDVRKAKRKYISLGNQQSTSAAMKKLREYDGNESSEVISNSVHSSEMSEENRKESGKDRIGKVKTSENENASLNEEDAASISIRRRKRVQTKVFRAAVMSKDSRDAPSDAATEVSDDRADEDAAEDNIKKTVLINHKEQTHDVEVPEVDDSVARGKTVLGSCRKQGRLSLKRKEEPEGPNVVEMLLKVKSEQGLKVKSESGAAGSSAKIGKDKDVNSPPVAPSLVNLGNTCFLNSVLQVFYYTPGFLENLQILYSEISSSEKDLSSVADFDSKLEVTCRSSRSWKLVRNLNELLQKMKQMEMLIAEQRCQVSSPINPSELLNTIQILNPLFVVGQQQDSHELLRCLLAFIQEAIHQLNCCRMDLRALQNNHHPSVNGHGTSMANGENGTSSTNDADTCIGFGKNGKGRVEREITVERKNSGRQQRKRSKLQLSDGSNKTNDRTINANGKKGNSPPSSSKSETTGTKGSPGSSLSPQTSLKSQSASSKAASSNSSLTKSSIMSYFGAALKPRSLNDIVLRTESVSDFVESLCQGRLEQRTKCLDCEQVTRSVEDFQDVALPVKKVTKSRVPGGSSDSEDDEKEDEDYSWILKVVDEVERLDSENKFWCEVCVQHTEAERCIRYTEAPDVLTIQLKRFAAFSGFFGGFTKTMDCVGIPLHLPCLEHNCRKPENKDNKHRYELYAILSHSGISLSSGHYITYIRTPRSSGQPCDVTSCPNSSEKTTTDHKRCPVWYECDDEVVTSLSQCRLVAMLASDSATTPYILFYEKRHV